MIYRPLMLALVALWIALAGCASSPPSRFYMLTPLHGSEEESTQKANERCMLIGVGPIEVPAYLDRPQIITRISQNELDLAEFHKWAEPLKDSLARVLVQNLSTLLCTKGVFSFPWKDATKVDYQITLDVIRFDGSVGGTVSLVAQWSIFDGEGKEMIATGKSYIKEMAEGGDFKALVAAQSLALANLSRQIASAIREVSQ
ncbi:MAG: membrane integrity-associated transporter subunit PqiC [Deltaproteobacteria bacterium]|nr:membrane integrity-associated transporter subunit PqiC [Deltaproteobacteria bacterium]